MTTFYFPSPVIIIPPQTKFGGGGGGLCYTGISPFGRSGGLSVRKILSTQLLLQFQSNSLETWQKSSLGAVDVQDTHFVKIPSRNTELLPLI